VTRGHARARHPVPDFRTFRRVVRTRGLKWCFSWVIQCEVLPPLINAYLRPSKPADLVRLGTVYGGWWLPEFILRPGAVAYCAGAGDDISFDLALHERGMRVVTIDPTPLAVSHANAVAPKGDRFAFVPVGLWDTAAELRFYYPRNSADRNPADMSCSILNPDGTSEYFTAKVETLRELMDDLGDNHIDVLKLDIEGAAHRVIESFIADGVRPVVVCVEFEHFVPFRTVLRSIRLLEQSGYRLVHIECWNYTFVSATNQVPAENS
jgi:FkbM family methyltransferase